MPKKKKLKEKHDSSADRFTIFSDSYNVKSISEMLKNSKMTLDDSLKLHNDWISTHPTLPGETQTKKLSFSLKRDASLMTCMKLVNLINNSARRK